MKFKKDMVLSCLISFLSIVICIIIARIIFKLNNSIEKYDNNIQKTVIIQSASYNFTKWTKTIPNSSNGAFNISNWTDLINSVVSNKIMDSLSINDRAVLLIDPLDKDTYLPNIPEATLTNPVPIGYFISIVSSNQINKIDCSYNFENKVIGYFDRCDFNFIQAIIQSYRMNPSLIKLVQLDISNIQNISSVFDMMSIDIIITYYIPGSLFDTYLQSQPINILGFSTLDFNRVKLFYPYITPQNVSLKTLFTNDSKSMIQILPKNNLTILPQMTMKLLNIYKPPDILSTNNITEAFITRLTVDPTSLQPNYRCYGDLMVESKVQCDSFNDIVGYPKSTINEWDRPCNTDDECPFYKKNTLYPNKRGGCLNTSTCEMPIGVLQTAPRKFADTGRFQPFCYGCSPGNDPNCCNKTHDYAFTNDTSDRLAAGLKTSIPLM